jgi:tRNA(fMet)-specific endonuclease VapC
MTLMPPSLVDSDIVSLFLRHHPLVVARVHDYLRQHGHLFLSVLTRYEVLRGLRYLGSQRLLDEFERLCQQSLILPVTEPIVVRAADIYAYLRRQGQLISDADILIAAAALHHGLVLVTNNLPHFQRIPNLPISNWAQ